MIMRGLKLQKAIQLAAEERQTESEMAAHLNVSPGILAKLSRNPIFIRRVRQERDFLRVVRGAAPERGCKQTVSGFYELRAAEKRATTACSSSASITGRIKQLIGERPATKLILGSRQ